jgi:hypothetical protein
VGLEETGIRSLLRLVDEGLEELLKACGRNQRHLKLTRGQKFGLIFLPLLTVPTEQAGLIGIPLAIGIYLRERINGWRLDQNADRSGLKSGGDPHE